MYIIVTYVTLHFYRSESKAVAPSSYENQQHILADFRAHVEKFKLQNHLFVCLAFLPCKTCFAALINR